MSWLWTNLILWCSLIWLPWLMCHLLGNEARPKKNIIVGVTLPYEAQADPAVEELLASYQKQLRQAAWLLTVPALPCLFLRSAGLSMTLWFIWIIAACVVPTVPYVRCNRALARLKEERGWKRQSGEPAVIDLKAAAEKTRWLSPLWFLPPFLVSLVPLLFQRALWWLWLLNAGITALFYVCYRFPPVQLGQGVAHLRLGHRGLQPGTVADPGPCLAVHGGDPALLPGPLSGGAEHRDAGPAAPGETHRRQRAGLLR